MQTMKHVVVTLTHFVWKILLLESILLTVVALVWHWTDWHTTASYGAALSITGGIIIGMGLLALTRRGSSNDMILRKAQMLSSNYQGQRQFTSPYAESTRAWFWLIGLGIVTVGMGIVFNVFFP